MTNNKASPPMTTQPTQEAPSSDVVETGKDAWAVTDAYVGCTYEEKEATDVDGGPIWTTPIECNGGDAIVAEVVGGSKRESLARAHAVCRALHGGSIDGEIDQHIDRLYRSESEDDWAAAELLANMFARSTRAALASTAGDTLKAESERLREALKWIDFHKDNQDMNHVDFRTEAGLRANDALYPSAPQDCRCEAYDMMACNYCMEQNSRTALGSDQ